MRWSLLVLLLLAGSLAAEGTPIDNELAKRDKKIADLEKRLNKLEKKKRTVDLDQAVKNAEQDAKDNDKYRSDLWFKRAGPVVVRLIDVSLDAMFSAGYTSVKNQFVEGDLQAGGHDPRRRGFTLNQVELSFSGAVDPVFEVGSHFVFGEDGFELEAAYFQTVALPGGMQVEGGYFLTEFGRINPGHPHAWNFLDQPIVNSRIMGGDGTRGLGFRVGWLTPAPWFMEVHAGMQVANDETEVSFLGGEDDDVTIAGLPKKDRPVESFNEFLYLLRVDQHWDVGEHFGVSFGLSGLLGPNATGDSARTWVGGSDLLMVWNPEGTAEGKPYLKIQSEFIYRYYQVNKTMLDDGSEFDSTVLGDWGMYAFAVFGWHNRWSFGVRGEFADATRDGAIRAQDDPLRDRRFRATAMVEWRVSEFSRLRLQYNFDTMQHLQHSTAHSVWFCVELLIGKHPAHNYGQ